MAVALIDVFEVSPTSSGSRTYRGAGALQFFVVQSVVEPATTTFATISAFNYIATSSTVSGADKVVTWSNGATVGAAKNILLYVFGV